MRQYVKSCHSGFTLIELIVVLAILGLTVAIGTPNYLGIQAAQEKEVCEQTRSLILKQIKIDQAMGKNIEPNTYLEEVDGFSAIPKCPSGGQYSIVKMEDGYHVYCTIHMTEIVLASPFGNTFEEILDGFVEVTMHYYNENGRYPRSWGDYVFTDIGLDTADWLEPIDHILFEPKGNRLGIIPEEGYKFVFVTNDGEEETV